MHDPVEGVACDDCALMRRPFPYYYRNMASGTGELVFALLLLFFSGCSCASGDTAQRSTPPSKIISAVSDGSGGYKIVNGAVKGAILRANFTDRINTTGLAFLLTIAMIEPGSAGCIRLSLVDYMYTNVTEVNMFTSMHHCWTLPILDLSTCT